MSSGITFRQAIDNNKKQILKYLIENGDQYTSDICKKYDGEHEMQAVRKALNELRKEGLINSNDEIKMWRGKKWYLEHK
jgi:predicted transcriptional regulator